MALSRRIVRAIFWLALVFGAHGIPAADWPQWRGPNRDAVWTETGLMKSFPDGGLKIVWRAPLGRGWSSPVVAGGRVYVSDVEIAIARRNATERVVCFEEASGKLLWGHRYAVAYPQWAFEPTGGGPRATPLVRDGRVFSLGAMGHLVCLDAHNGAVLWQRDLAKDYAVREFTGITGSPLIEEGLLILNLYGKPRACVVAFEAKSGKEAWRALEDSFTYSSPLVITAGGKRQLIVWTQDAVTSLDPANGRTWWRERLHSPGDQAVATPVHSNHRLLVGGLMFQLDSNQPAARILWPATRAPSTRILSNTSTPLLRGEHIFSARTSGDLVCLEAATGREIWRTNSVTVPGNGSSIHLTPCGDVVYLFTDQGDLILAQLNSSGYREISRARLLPPTYPFGERKRAWTPPSFANRRVFARNDEELVCASLEKRP